MSGPTSDGESLLIAATDEENEMYPMNRDYAKVQNDYRREQLRRSYSPTNGTHHRFLPHLPSAVRARRAA